MPAARLLLVAAMVPAAAVLLSMAGCSDAPIGGGVKSVPTVRIRVAELDDEDVPTQPVSESTSSIPVLGPTGEAIVPPEQRVDADAEPDADDA